MGFSMHKLMNLWSSHLSQMSAMYAGWNLEMIMGLHILFRKQDDIV